MEEPGNTEGVCQECGNDNVLTTPCIHFTGVEESVAEVEKKLKPKPQVFKFVDGELVPLEEGESAPPNHNERRKIERQIRRHGHRSAKQGPKKKPAPHAKKWNHDARRHLERTVAVMEQRAQQLQMYLDSLKAELEKANKENEAA